MTDTLYTIKQIAEAIGAGESTIRYWRDQYKDFIPTEFSPASKTPLYNAAALEIFDFIKKQADTGAKGAAIYESLKSQYPVVPQIAKPEESSTAAVTQYGTQQTQLTQFFSTMSEFTELLKDRTQEDRSELERRQKRIEIQEELIAKQAQQIGELQGRLESQEEHIKELRKQLEREQKKSVLQRLIGTD